MNAPRFPRPTVMLPLLGVVALLPALSSCSEDKERKRQRATKVQTVQVEAATMRDTAEAIGSLQASETVELRAERPGTIMRIGFEEGRTVSEGQLLFELEREELDHSRQAKKAALKEARARLTNAEWNFERMENLREEGVAAEEEYRNARDDYREAHAAVERIEAELAEIREQIADTTISAPFDAEISRRLVDVGDYVTAGQTLATAYRTKVMEAAFELPERYAGRIEEGMPVRVRVAAHPDRIFEGGVTFVGPSVDRETRTFPVEAVIDNSEGLLVPGTFADTAVVLETRENVPVVPEEALVSTREGYLLFVVEDGVAHRRDITTGLREPGRVEIREGVETGELVVRTGHMGLAEGDEVRTAGEAASEEGGHAGEENAPGASD